MSETKPPNAPLTEEQILAANIGAPLVLDSPIALSPYDPHWPQHYATLARDIHAALGARVPPGRFRTKLKKTSAARLSEEIRFGLCPR
jgi:hypothetical protein